MDHLNKCRRYISEAERKRLNEVALDGCRVSAFCRSLFAAGWCDIDRVCQRLSAGGSEFERLLFQLAAPEGIEWRVFRTIACKENTG
jgi:hypothetical protein